jgi:hypothetical protein
MANAWEMAKGLAEKHANNGGIFVRLAANGDKVTGVFVGEPYAREVVWTGERYEPYDAKDPAHQADGKKPSLRVAINFYVIAENAMKVIEGGTQWFKDVLKIRDKYGLDKWSFEIERHGDAGDPKTKYTILPEEKLDAALRAKLGEVPPHDLAALVNGGGDAEDAKPAGKAPAPTASAAANKDRAIDPATAAELVARMKVLNRADLEALLGQLGVPRVRDLKLSELVRANALLAAFESGTGGAAADVDPFA